ncbi:MAG TPA: hypothetical protein DCY03_28930 [Planctomycetaceae bacterium]|nr:hypothetical protein [Planctomycetaceae bacterium]
MSDLPFIRCLGCESTVFDPTRAACPGCGRCPVCGTRRFKTEVKTCPDCELPYCDCCGRCPQCAGLRYSEIITPCESGHPQDAEKLADLVRYEAAVGAIRRPTPWGCILAALTLSAVVLLLIYAWKG